MARHGEVGLDVHAELAEIGRAAPRFVGSVGPRIAELTWALGRVREPHNLRVVYVAGPCAATDRCNAVINPQAADISVIHRRL